MKKNDSQLPITFCPTAKEYMGSAIDKSVLAEDLIIKPNQPILDELNRPLQDLRISVTDRCNFRCTYCMPKSVYDREHSFLPKENIISFEEIIRIVNLLTPYGLNKVRITGGEPLIRHDLPVLINALKKIPKLDVALTTNGSLLAKRLDLLKDIGLSRLTISLDAINDKIFTKMNDVGFSVNKILSTINQAVELGFNIKINMVVMGGHNEQEILPMAKYFRENFQGQVILRFIEFMDVGNSNSWKMDKVVSGEKIFETINKHFPLAEISANYKSEVARRYQYQDGKGEIGIISSVSRAFCKDCSRLRLSANGQLFTCLFSNSGYDLRQLIRNGCSDNQLINAIINIWQKRNDRYSELRSEFLKAPQKKIEMSFIGG